jgi:hypothetical protein
MFRTFFVLFLSIILDILLPVHALAHGDDHHDHADADDRHEDQNQEGEPEIILDLRLMTGQQIEQGNFGFLLDIKLDWGETDLNIFTGLGSPRVRQTLTGVSFTQGIEVEFLPVEEVAFHLGGTYHIGPFEDTSATAGILEGGITLFPTKFLSLHLNGGLRGLSLDEETKSLALAEEEEGHHTPLLLPAIHGGHPEHVEEGTPEWFVSAEMRINLWRSP